MQKRNNRRAVIIPVIIAVSIAAGVILGWYLPSGSHADQRERPSPSGKIGTLMQLIGTRYVDDVDMAEIEETALPAILRGLDPHSVYIPARDLSRANEQIAGNFDGIGITFNMITDTLLVISTVPGGPSERVGIMAGDKIIYVNDSIIAGVSIPDETVIGMLRGPRGTKVEVSVERRGVDELMTFEITRDQIPITTVDVAYMMTPETGYIKVTSFSMTTFNEFVTALRELKNKGMERLILDLRGNSGGVMDAATRMADQFLSDGSMIVYTEGRAFPRDDIKATRGGEFLEGDLVVLIDEFSASASEIVAGAIQDNDRGTVIGRRSFGKGLVQEPIMFRDGSGLRLTIARYYTPSGRSIQKPYGDGYEEYYNDLNERFLRGELRDADSIRFADSLQYTTKGGRVVFGGGGIMPDIFVPVDTTGVSDYFLAVRNSGIITRFSLYYTENNRESLSRIDTAEEMVSYLKSRNLLNSFVAYAESAGVAADPEGIKTSGEVIEIQLMAYIARNILNNRGFYPIWERLDNTLLKALEYISGDDR